jgi:hypothetical protein
VTARTFLGDWRHSLFRHHGSFSRELNKRLDGGGGVVATLIKEEKYILDFQAEE